MFRFNNKNTTIDVVGESYEPLTKVLGIHMGLDEYEFRESVGTL